MKLLDTTFLIDLIRGREEALKIIEKEEILLTTQINMFEIIKGLYLMNVSRANFPKVINLFQEIRILPLDDKGIIKSAEISSDLYKEGLPVDDSDCLIAGIALSHSVDVIITRNSRHFDRIKGIKVETY